MAVQDNERRQLKHHARQAEIANAAADVICQRGIRNTSLRDIAEHMSVTTGKIQHYFASKEDLLRFTANFCIDRMTERAFEKSEQLSGADRLRVFCEEMLPLNEQRRQAWQVGVAFNGATIGDGVLTDVEVKRYAEAQKTFAAIISTLKDEGVVFSDVDPKVAGYGLTAFLEGLAMQIVFSRQRRNLTYAKRLISEYIQQMIGIQT